MLQLSIKSSYRRYVDFESVRPCTDRRQPWFCGAAIRIGW